jgi:hypothetical protein
MCTTDLTGMMEKEKQHSRIYGEKVPIGLLI